MQGGDVANRQLSGVPSYGMDHRPDRPLNRNTEGREAIRARLRSGWEVPLPDLERGCAVDHLGRRPGRVSLGVPVIGLRRLRARGTDRYRFVDDLIVELTVSLDTESDRPDEP